MALEEGDGLAAALLDRPAVAAPLRAIEGPPAAQAPALMDEVVGDSDDDGVVQPMAVVAPEADAPEAGDDPAGLVVGEDEVDPMPALDGVPHEILGQRVMRVKGRHGGGWTYHDRISVRCRNPAHPNCTKSRSLAIDRSVHGPRAAGFFLGAWLTASEMPEGQHRGFAPSVAEVRAFAAGLDA